MGGGFPGFAGFDRSIETAKRAFALGIRYFDTSVMYRHGGSQAILGEALANQTARHFLATKVGYFKQAHLDVMTGADAVIAMGIADPNKLVKMGWSAGGHMTNKIITFTDRFKAASSGAGAAHRISI